MPSTRALCGGQPTGPGLPVSPVAVASDCALTGRLTFDDNQRVYMSCRGHSGPPCRGSCSLRDLSHSGPSDVAEHTL